MNKITEKELETIKEQQTNLEGLIREVGVLESQKHASLHKIGELNNEILDFKNELESTYGAVEINLSDGTFATIEKELVEENV